PLPAAARNSPASGRPPHRAHDLAIESGHKSGTSRPGTNPPARQGTRASPTRQPERSCPTASLGKPPLSVWFVKRQSQSPSPHHRLHPWLSNNRDILAVGAIGYNQAMPKTHRISSFRLGRSGAGPRAGPTAQAASLQGPRPDTADLGRTAFVLIA